MEPNIRMREVRSIVKKILCLKMDYKIVKYVNRTTEMYKTFVRDRVCGPSGDQNYKSRTENCVKNRFRYRLIAEDSKSSS